MPRPSWFRAMTAAFTALHRRVRREDIALNHGASAGRYGGAIQGSAIHYAENLVVTGGNEPQTIAPAFFCRRSLAEFRRRLRRRKIHKGYIGFRRLMSSLESGGKLAAFKGLSENRVR